MIIIQAVTEVRGNNCCDTSSSTSSEGQHSCKNGIIIFFFFACLKWTKDSVLWHVSAVVFCSINTAVNRFPFRRCSTWEACVDNYTQTVMLSLTCHHPALEEQLLLISNNIKKKKEAGIGPMCVKPKWNENIPLLLAHLSVLIRTSCDRTGSRQSPTLGIG